MSEKPFYVSVPEEAVGAHEVVLDEGGDFFCNDCAASSLTDGYGKDGEGAQRWHNSLQVQEMR